MEGRKLNVTTLSPHKSVRDKRAAYDQHINHCETCAISQCWDAHTLWRALCLEAIRLHAAPVHPIAGV